MEIQNRPQWENIVQSIKLVEGNIAECFKKYFITFLFIYMHLCTHVHECMCVCMHTHMNAVMFVLRPQYDL